MTILSWVAGFQMRTGWHFLSAEESAQLSETLQRDGPLRPIARRADGGVACLDTSERNPRHARVLIFSHPAPGNSEVQEEHATLAAWVHALGLTSQQNARDAHGGG